MYCNNCGNEIVQPNTKFCNNCGCRLGQQASENENKNHTPFTPIALFAQNIPNANDSNTRQQLQDWNRNDPHKTAYLPGSFGLLAKRITLLLFLPFVIAAMLLLGNLEPIYFYADPTGMIEVTCGIFVVSGILIFLVRSILVYVLIYRCWAIQREGNPRTSPGWAVGLTFVPFFNLYWIFVAIVGLASDMNKYRNQFGLTHVKPVSIGLAVMICVLLPIPYIDLLTFFLWIPFSFSLARVADAIQEYRLKNNLIVITPEAIKLATQQRLWGFKTTIATLLVAVGSFVVVTFGLNAYYHFDCVNESLFDAAYYASYHGNDEDAYIKKAQRAIFWGADVNAKDDYGNTPLHSAVSGEVGVAMTKFLINKGADVNAKDNNGKIPLHEVTYYDIEEGSLEVVKYLIEKGADVNAKDNDGNTPLHNATRSIYGKDSLEVVKYLIEKGAYVNAKDNDGDTPLHNAVGTYSGASLEIVKYLIEKGAKLNSRNKDGYRPLAVARNKKREEIAEVLEQAEKSQ